jgi:hypothetical protein
MFSHTHNKNLLQYKYNWKNKQEYVGFITDTENALGSYETKLKCWWNYFMPCKAQHVYQALVRAEFIIQGHSNL